MGTLEQAVGPARREEEAATSRKSWNRHKQRAKTGNMDSEVRISSEEYHDTVIKVLRSGYTLEVALSGKPRIRLCGRLEADASGFNADRLRKDGEQIGRRDKDLLFSLEWRFRDFSDDTPLVCSFSPHQNNEMVSGG